MLPTCKAALIALAASATPVLSAPNHSGTILPDYCITQPSIIVPPLLVTESAESYTKIPPHTSLATASPLTSATEFSNTSSKDKSAIVVT